MTTLDKEAINQACEEVRDDGNETNWILMGFEEKNIVVVSKGVDYDEFLSNLSDEERYFGYVRFICGDEMSKRAKFVFITWIGASVSPLKRAKMSTDKIQLKTVVTNFATEILAEHKNELDYLKVQELVAKAGGANYGTGQR